MKKALVVDDVEDNIVLLKFELEDDGFDVVTALSGEICLDIAENMQPDIILLDIRMPGLSGLQTLEKLKLNTQTQDIPVIMVSASSADKSVIDALDIGAHDFVNKPVVYPVLAARMRSALRLVTARDELEQMNHKLQLLATQDALTETYNRRHFFALAEAEFSKAKRHNRQLSILMVDIDNFKEVNDTYGHSCGDEALRQFSKICTEEIRDSDIFGRIGGEEFALCLPDADKQGAKLLAERIRERCENLQLNTNSTVFTFTVSIGITEVLREDCGLSDTLLRADNLLYEAKKNGRNQSMAS